MRKCNRAFSFLNARPKRYMPLTTCWVFVMLVNFSEFRVVPLVIFEHAKLLTEVNVGLHGEATI